MRTTTKRALLKPDLRRDQWMSQTRVKAVAAVRTAPVGLTAVTLNSGAGPRPFALEKVVVRMLDCSPSSWEATMR